MQLLVGVILALLSTVRSMTVGSPVCRSSVTVRAPHLKMGLLDDLSAASRYLPIQQMIDQRIAKVSQIFMGSGQSRCSPDRSLTFDEARELFERWKVEIDNDPEKFAQYAIQYSDDVDSAGKGGDLGYCTRLKQLPPQLDDVVFVKDPIPGVYGPIGSPKGLHLIYLFSCREPK